MSPVPRSAQVKSMRLLPSHCIGSGAPLTGAPGAWLALLTMVTPTLPVKYPLTGGNASVG
jgi:hypothetical protein